MENMNNKSENTENNISKWDLIKSIIAFELGMFLEVKTNKTDDNSECQKKPEMFKLMRWMSHSVLSVNTLKFYLEDLISAKIANRNLMTEKYALIDNLIPHTNENPVIDKIAEIEVQWMQELKPKYPNLLQQSSTIFKKYMLSEYETYSDETLNCLMNDINTAVQKNLNLTKLRYNNLFKRLGYSSIEELELKCKK